MRGQALVVSICAVALNCLVHEAAAQSQQGGGPNPARSPTGPARVRNDGQPPDGWWRDGEARAGTYRGRHDDADDVHPYGRRRRRLNLLAGVSSRARAHFQRHGSKQRRPAHNGRNAVFRGHWDRPIAPIECPLLAQSGHPVAFEGKADIPNVDVGERRPAFHASAALSCRKFFPPAI